MGVLVVGLDVRVQRHGRHDWKLGQLGSRSELTYRVQFEVQDHALGAPDIEGWHGLQIKSPKVTIRGTAMIKKMSPILGFVLSGGGSHMSETRRKELADIPAVDLGRRLASVSETGREGKE